MEKLGVKLETVTAGEHKDMFLPGRMTSENREIVQVIVDQSYDQFVTAVAAGRENLSEEQVRELATGQVYTGEQAYDLGLVDMLGGLDAAVNEAGRLAGLENPRIEEFNVSFWDVFFSGAAVEEVHQILSGYLVRYDVALLEEFLNGQPSLRY